MDFNPDLTENTEPKKAEVVEDIDIKKEITTIAENSQNVISMNSLIKMTLDNMEQDYKCRQTLEEINKALEEVSSIMSSKELIEYMKVKINERKFYVECIFKAFEIVQKSEMAKEMFLGAERKERIAKAAYSSTYNKLFGLLNMNAEEES